MASPTGHSGPLEVFARSKVDASAQGAQGPAHEKLAGVDGVAGAELVDEVGSAAQDGSGDERSPQVLGAGDEGQADPGDDGQGGTPLGGVGLWPCGSRRAPRR